MIQINEVCNFLEEHGIEYKKLENVGNSGLTLIYLDHGAYGHPSGLKIKKGTFRPDFRISVHDDDPKGKVYTKVCGYTSYMTLDEVLKTVSGEES